MRRAYKEVRVIFTSYVDTTMRLTTCTPRTRHLWLAFLMFSFIFKALLRWRLYHFLLRFIWLLQCRISENWGAFITYKNKLLMLNYLIIFKLLCLSSNSLLLAPSYIVLLIDFMFLCLLWLLGFMYFPYVFCGLDWL